MAPSQVKLLISPKAKSQAKDKRAKDRQEYAALRCKVGVAPPGFVVRRRMSRVAFRVFPAGRAGDTRAAICSISCFLSLV
jgi:ribosomal protein S14